jgi:hypothetical protein
MGTISCAVCNMIFLLDDALESRLRTSHKSFYCPNGHSQYFAQKTDLEKANDTIKNLTQELNQVRQVRDQYRRSISTYKGIVTKLKRRM